MRTIKLFTFVALAIFFIQACANKTESATMEQDTNSIDTMVSGCLVAYDVNPFNNMEKINQVYGKDKVKEGHWINFSVTVEKTVNNTSNRIRLEEGYYKKNKKEGYWKFFNDDGTLEDSVEYKNNIPLVRN